MAVGRCGDQEVVTDGLGKVCQKGLASKPNLARDCITNT